MGKSAGPAPYPRIRVARRVGYGSGAVGLFLPQCMEGDEVVVVPVPRSRAEALQAIAKIAREVGLEAHWPEDGTVVVMHREGL